MTELEEYFIYKCRKGLDARGLSGKKTYQERLDFEMKTIIKMGFPGYFLIVQDFINWAKNNDIYVGPGRGSAAGSLVAYVLRITNLDPIKWDLLFERFLNPGRVSMPDIDVDFEKRYRDRVIHYVTDKYGEDRVAHIGTFGTMKAKSAVRSVTKTLGHPYVLGDELCKMLLEPIHGKVQPLAESIAKVPELQEIVQTTSTKADVMRWAQKVEGIISNAGVHASGIVIANNSLTEAVPMFRGRGGEITTQWEMNNVEDAGYIKFDFLGLDALSKMHRCADMVKERKGIEIDIDAIDLEDDNVFAKLRSGDSVGIFQLEASSGMRDLLVQIRPTHLEDIIALVAIYRPGPLDADYKDVYFAIRAGEMVPQYLVPELEPILSKTEGWLIYQEQCMQIAKELCGYSLSEADILRKAIGKKKQDVMDAQEKKFKDGWIANGLPADKGDLMWAQIVSFASYGFNRSHAAAYGLMTYQTAYLKTYFPHEFMCAVMISESGNQDDMIKCIAECKRMGIKVLPPDINTSQEEFSVNDEDEIRFGLAPIKNMGNSVDEIINERQRGGPFKSMRNFCERVDLGIINRGKIESLVKAGAMDQFGHSRATLLKSIQDIWDYREQSKRYDKKLETYEKKLEAQKQRLIDIDNGVLSPKGKPLKPLKDPAKPEKPEWPELLEVDEMPEHELLKYEHELLGFYVSSHPLEKYQGTLHTQDLNTLEEVKLFDDKTDVSIAAVVASKKPFTTKNKQQMCFLKLEDMTGQIEAVLFPRQYNIHKHLLEEIVPLKIHGRVEIKETDDGKIAKMAAFNIELLDEDAGKVYSKDITLQVPARKAKEMAKLLDDCKGEAHKARVILELQDGTKIMVKQKLGIGNFTSTLQREALRMRHE